MDCRKSSANTPLEGVHALYKSDFHSLIIPLSKAFIETSVYYFIVMIQVCWLFKKIYCLDMIIYNFIEEFEKILFSRTIEKLGPCDRVFLWFVCEFSNSWPHKI